MASVRGISPVRANTIAAVASPSRLSSTIARGLGNPLFLGQTIENLAHQQVPSFQYCSMIRVSAFERRACFLYLLLVLAMLGTVGAEMS